MEQKFAEFKEIATEKDVMKSAAKHIWIRTCKSCHHNMPLEWSVAQPEDIWRVGCCWHQMDDFQTTITSINDKHYRQSTSTAINHNVKKMYVECEDGVLRLNASLLG